MFGVILWEPFLKHIHASCLVLFDLLLVISKIHHYIFPFYLMNQKLGGNIWRWNEANFCDIKGSIDKQVSR